MSKAIFEDFVVAQVKKDLVDAAVEKGEIVDEEFYKLTEPKSAGAGLRHRVRIPRRHQRRYARPVRASIPSEVYPLLDL